MSIAAIYNSAYPSMPEPMDLLAMAWDDVAAEAYAVGIDAEVLRTRLPAPGMLMKGADVPVTDRAYRHTCSVLMYINRLSGGDEWPFLRFATFKHGGVQSKFNGYRWWRRHQTDGGQAVTSRVVAMEESQYDAAERQRQEEAWRQERFQRWSQHWPLALPVSAQHPWIERRLAGCADEALLARIDLRVKSNFHGETLMAPLQHVAHGHSGFQLLHLEPGCLPGGEAKRMCLPRAGMMGGSFIHIRPDSSAHGASCLPVALCEGLATGLSLAVAWPGEIRVALYASNLDKVRRGISGPAVLFHDEDLWKPHAGNVGLSKALAAWLPGDSLCGPTFAAGSLAHQPTDFNDLLCLEGRNALVQQLSRLYSA